MDNHNQGSGIADRDNYAGEKGPGYSRSQVNNRQQPYGGGEHAPQPGAQDNWANSEFENPNARRGANAPARGKAAANKMKAEAAKKKREGGWVNVLDDPHVNVDDDRGMGGGDRPDEDPFGQQKKSSTLEMMNQKPLAEKVQPRGRVNNRPEWQSSNDYNPSEPSNNNPRQNPQPPRGNQQQDNRRRSDYANSQPNPQPLQNNRNTPQDNYDDMP